VAIVIGNWQLAINPRLENHKSYEHSSVGLAQGDYRFTYQGAQMIEAWNVAGLDYATFGNHEFDFGPGVLLDRIKESRFSWIAANVIDTKTGQPFGGVQPFLIREFGGVKIGIFGLVLPETREIRRSGRVAPRVEGRTKRLDTTQKSGNNCSN
jgi:2',3'-cyclic-nucleotide 2'-phosphodiesterase (5'-nucleotidase family)